MKVAIVNQHMEDALGGSEIQCNIIARELTRRGIDVIYIAPGGRGSYINVSYPVVTCARSGPAIAAACLAGGADIVYWRFNKYGFRSAARVLASHKCPLVFSVSGINDFKAWPVLASGPSMSLRGVGSYLKSVVRNMWNHTGFRWATAVVVLNADYLGQAPVRAQIHIPNSMDITSASFSWPRPYVAWVANLKATKRPEMCIPLAQHLQRQGVDLLMVGRMAEPQYRWLEDPAQLPSNLHYLGEQPVDVASSIIGNARCFVHTCRPEGFGNNFIQAWLQKIPVVSFEFDPGGLLDKEQIGVCALGSWQGFISAVDSMLENGVVSSFFVERAHTYAREHFDPAMNVARLEDFLRDILNDHRRSLKVHPKPTGSRQIHQT